MSIRYTEGMLEALFIFVTIAAASAHPPGEGHHQPADSDSERYTLTLPEVPEPRVAPALAAAPLMYDVVADWCSLPDAQPLGNTHGGIVIDPDGLIYYNTDTTRSIMVHRPDGTFVRTLAAEFPGIHGMVLRVEHGTPYLYAAHLHGKQVLKLTLDGEVVWKLGVPKESGKYDDDPGAYNPTAVAVGPDGDIYVADGYGRQWIHQFNSNRQYIRSFGGHGTAPGEFRTCHGLMLDERGDVQTLIVCDRENRRLQRFTLEGELIDVLATDSAPPLQPFLLG